MKVDAVYNRRSLPISNGDVTAANQFRDGWDMIPPLPPSVEPLELDELN